MDYVTPLQALYSDFRLVHLLCAGWLVHLQDALSFSIRGVLPCVLPSVRRLYGHHGVSAQNALQVLYALHGVTYDRLYALIRSDAHP